MKQYCMNFPQAELEACRDYWIAVGRSTDPVNKPKVEQGLAMAYETAGLAPPRKIIYRDSPYQGSIEAKRLGFTENSPNQAGRSVNHQVCRHIQISVWNAVREQSNDQVWIQVARQVWGHIWNQINGKTSIKIWDQLIKQVSSHSGREYLDQVCSAVFTSQHASDDLARLMIYKELPAIKKLAGLAQIAENAGWVFLFEHLAIVTARPSKLLWRNGERIHIEYPDGWTVSSLSPLEQLADVVDT